MMKPARKTAPRAKKRRKTIKFLQKPTCATCRKARRFLEGEMSKFFFGGGSAAPEGYKPPEEK